LYTEQIKELSLTSKLDWHNEDIEHLIQGIFKSTFNEIEPGRTISKAEEKSMLEFFNNSVVEISQKEGINPTLFFSKKAQKDFLRLTLIEGLDEASKVITKWRANLIREEILQILR
jgi:ribonuclease D